MGEKSDLQTALVYVKKYKNAFLCIICLQFEVSSLAHQANMNFPPILEKFKSNMELTEDLGHGLQCESLASLFSP